MNNKECISARKLRKQLDKIRKSEEDQGIFRNVIDYSDVVEIIDELEDEEVKNILNY